jgi:biopolymer transport protein ExbD
MYLNKSFVESNAFEKHLVARKRKNNWKKKAAGFVLMLTSMVDMFSMLVVFLLQTFSSSPEILINKGVTLPNSFTSTEVIEAPVLAINKDGNIYLDQKLIGEAKVVAKAPKKLLNKLNLIKQDWAKSHNGAAFPGEINLQADKEIKSTLVSDIMSILTTSEYESIQLAVVGGQ